jgi:hemolysin activation/secretion protein
MSCALAAAVAMAFALPLSAQAQDAAAAAASDAGPRFDVLEFRVEGNSVLPAERIERAVYPFMGEKRTVADVESARVALESAYRDAGFGTVVVDTPEQKIVDGVVTLQVLQAPVSRLRVTGARYYSQGAILAKVPALAEGQVPNFPVVTEQLATVNRSADRRVTPLLRPGKAPGTTEVDLQVEDKMPLHGSLELNNKYSANTTKSRLQASLRYDNLWQKEHSIGVQVQVSPEDTSQVKVYSGSYTVPTGNGLVVFSAIKSNSNTVAGVGGTQVFGRGNIYGLRNIFLLDGTEVLNHSITLGVDYKDFKESVSVGANEGFNTPVHYLPLSFNYAATHLDKQGYWTAGGGLTLAVRGLFSEESQFEDKRFKAQSNFTILKGNVGRLQNLPQGYTLFGTVEAQYSDQALISNEQFVAGGVDSVRGYLDSTAVGDKGLRASIELRTGNLGAERLSWLGGLQAHTFFDAAYLKLNDPLPEQKDSFTLMGVGFGLKLQAKQYASLALDLAWPLRDSGETQKGSPRLHASGVLEF